MTTDIKLSPTRVAVLRAVARGEVSRKPPIHMDKPCRDVWKWIPGAERSVASHIEKLSVLKLVKLGPRSTPSFFSSRAWELTDLGREWLASNPEES